MGPKVRSTGIPLWYAANQKTTEGLQNYMSTSCCVPPLDMTYIYIYKQKQNIDNNDALIGDDTAKTCSSLLDQ